VLRSGGRVGDGLEGWGGTSAHSGVEMMLLSLSNLPHLIGKTS
jgi:hypothetical protein